VAQDVAADQEWEARRLSSSLGAAMSNIIDITGQRFNRLTVVACAGRTKRGNTIWTCRVTAGMKDRASVAPAVGIDHVLRLLAPGGLVNRGRKKINR
jgi:hypothetical protein